MTAQVRTIDFTKAPDRPQRPSGRLRGGTTKPMTADGKLLTPKQIRARARRRRKRGEHMTAQEMEFLYHKPLEEWDMEELAHGRPKNSAGKFSGPVPRWIDRSIHEAAMSAFTEGIRGEMRGATVKAMDRLVQVLENESTDDRGKPIVAASTKVDVAKFLLEHVVGKPTQRVETDVSVRLQGILAHVLVNPEDRASHKYTPAHLPGVTMELATGDEDEIVIE